MLIVFAGNPAPVLRFFFSRRMETLIMPRELIDTGTDKRYVRRDKDGRFKESDDVGRSHAQDQKRDAKSASKKGEGDKGDRQ
jgi:hypothetical protein